MSAYGHCGVGLIHTKILMDTSKKSQWQGAKQAVKEVYDFVHKIGGTTSGEHGIGFAKKKFFPIGIGVEELQLMKGIKRLFDPKNILNPGKIFDL